MTASPLSGGGTGSGLQGLSHHLPSGDGPPRRGAAGRGPSRRDLRGGTCRARSAQPAPARSTGVRPTSTPPVGPTNTTCCGVRRPPRGGRTAILGRPKSCVPNIWASFTERTLDLVPQGPLTDPPTSDTFLKSGRTTPCIDGWLLFSAGRLRGAPLSSMGRAGPSAIRAVRDRGRPRSGPSAIRADTTRTGHRSQPAPLSTGTALTGHRSQRAPLSPGTNRPELTIRTAPSRSSATCAGRRAPGRAPEHASKPIGAASTGPLARGRTIGIASAGPQIEVLGPRPGPVGAAPPRHGRQATHRRVRRRPSLPSSLCHWPRGPWHSFGNRAPMARSVDRDQGDRASITRAPTAGVRWWAAIRPGEGRSIDRAPGRTPAARLRRCICPRWRWRCPDALRPSRSVPRTRWTPGALDPGRAVARPAPPFAGLDSHWHRTSLPRG